MAATSTHLRPSAGGSGSDPASGMPRCRNGGEENPGWTDGKGRQLLHSGPYRELQVTQLRGATSQRTISADGPEPQQGGGLLGPPPPPKTTQPTRA